MIPIEIVEFMNHKIQLSLNNITEEDEDPGGNYRTFRIPSLHPNAYSVVFDNFNLIDSEPGIYLTDGNLKILIKNGSGYKQIYNYAAGDAEGWFDNILSEQIIFYSSRVGGLVLSLYWWTILYLICCLMQVGKGNTASFRKFFEFTPKVKKSKVTDLQVSNILFHS